MSTATDTANSAAEAQAFFREVTNTVCGIVEAKKPPKAWYIAITISSLMLAIQNPKSSPALDFCPNLYTG